MLDLLFVLLYVLLVTLNVLLVQLDVLLVLLVKFLEWLGQGGDLLDAFLQGLFQDLLLDG